MYLDGDAYGGGTSIDPGQEAGDPSLTGDMPAPAPTPPASPIPAGVITPYGGPIAPTGWLLCDGASYLQTAFPDLFAAIGVAYGGDLTHFNVPNFDSSLPMGQGLFVAIGDVGGSFDHHHFGPDHAHTVTATHTHTGPSHDHASAAHTHAHTTTHTHTSAAHTHAHTATHTHTGPSHTHGVNDHVHAMIHAHGQPTHTHTGNTHNHDLPFVLAGTTSVPLRWARNLFGAGSSSQTMSKATSTNAVNDTTTTTVDRVSDPTSVGNTGAGGGDNTNSQSTNNTQGEQADNGTSAAGTGATGATAPGTSDSTTPGATGATAPGTSDSTTPANTGLGGTGASGATASGTTDLAGTGVTTDNNPPFVGVAYIIKT